MLEDEPRVPEGVPKVPSDCGGYEVDMMKELDQRRSFDTQKWDRPA